MMEEFDQNIPSEYRPLSPWAYFGYSLLFSIPLIGIICLIIFAFDSTNINRRNYARSFFCAFLIAAILFLVLMVLGINIATITSRSL